MANVTNLFIDQGSNTTVTIYVTDNTGTARNLSGYSARSQLRRSYTSTSNTSFTVSISNPADGEITINLTADQTANLKYGRYVYDVELISNSYSVERIIEGIITVYPEVTK